MGRTIVFGAIGGLALAGLAVALVLPQLPAAWRSEGLVWAGSTILIALCVMVVFLASRPARK